jgi:hypothetical protein
LLSLETRPKSQICRLDRSEAEWRDLRFPLHVHQPNTFHFLTSFQSVLVAFPSMNAGTRVLSRGQLASSRWAGESII